MPLLSLVCRFAAIAGIQCAVLLSMRRCVPANRLFWPCAGTMMLLSVLGVCLPPAFTPAVSALALVLEPFCLILPFRPRGKESVLCFFLIFYPFILLLILYQMALSLAGYTVIFVPLTWGQLPGTILRFLPVAAGLWLLCRLPGWFSAWRRLPVWVPAGLLAVDRLGGLFSLGMEARGLIPSSGLSLDALLLLGCFSSVVLVLGIAAALLVWQDRRSTRLYIEQLERQHRMQLEYYRSLSDTLQEFRLLRHDLRHYLNLLGDTPSQLRQNLQETVDKAGRVELCGDPYLNAVLFEKIRLAREKQVRLETRAALDGPAPVPVPALICAASNLLENALEAARPGETVELNAACRAGMLVMEVTNPLHAGDRFPPPQGFSFKGGTLHGLGLTSVRRTVEEADGSLSLELRDGRAVARVTLPCLLPGEADGSIPAVLPDDRKVCREK